MVIEKCQEFIMQSMNGVEIENSKIDFKKKWPDLKSAKGINDFLKVITAIANTFGPDGYYIIGHDEKSKTLHDVSFSDCGLRDTSDLQFLIVKHCSNIFHIDYYPFKYEDKNLGVIHIPPTLEKPIFIKRFDTFDKNGKIKTSTEQRVFVRKGSATFPASKDDFELMFYDRKNIEPEYDYNIYLNSIGIFRHTLIPSKGVREQFLYECHVNLTFENIGRRAISIKNYEVIGYKGDQEISFKFFNNMENLKSKSSGKFISDIYKPGETTNNRIILESKDIGHLISTNYFDYYKLIAIRSDNKIIYKEYHKTKTEHS